MQFIKILAIIAVTNAASIPKISELFHKMDVNGKKLQIRAIPETTPERQPNSLLLPTIFKTFGINLKPLYKIIRPITFLTEEPIINIIPSKELDYTIPTIVDPVKVYDENLMNKANIIIENRQKSSEEDCDLTFVNINATNGDEMLTEDPIQNTDNVEVIFETTESNQPKIDLEKYNVGSGDEKEFIFLNGFSNDFGSKDSIVDSTALRLKRSANVIEKENQSTTVSGHKLNWSGRDASLAYNALFKNINA